MHRNISGSMKQGVPLCFHIDTKAQGVGFQGASGSPWDASVQSPSAYHHIESGGLEWQTLKCSRKTER